MSFWHILTSCIAISSKHCTWWEVSVSWPSAPPAFRLVLKKKKKNIANLSMLWCNCDLLSEVRFQCEGYFGPMRALWFKMVPNHFHKKLSQDSKGEVRVSVLIMWPVNTSVMFTPNIHYYLNRGWEQGARYMTSIPVLGRQRQAEFPEFRGQTGPHRTM